MKQTRDFLRIPVNRIIALILVDIMSIVIAAFGALYVRFDFSFAGIPPVYIEKFEHVILPNIIITLLFFTLWKLYKSVWRYASANELLNIFLQHHVQRLRRHCTAIHSAGICREAIM